MNGGYLALGVLVIGSFLIPISFEVVHQFGNWLERKLEEK